MSSIPAMMRSLSACCDITRMWRRTERANLAKNRSMRSNHDPCLEVKARSKHQPVEWRVKLWFFAMCAE